jgi:hypothetical protein
VWDERSLWQNTKRSLKEDRMRRIITGVMLAAVFAGALNAQETDVLAFYDGEMMKITYEQFGGLQVQFQSITENTASVRRSQIADELRRYPESQVHFDAYVRKRLGGMTLIWTGIGSAVLSPFVLLGSENSEELTRNIGTAAILYSSGLLATTIGGIVVSGSTDSLVTSVNTYNRERIKDNF